MKPHPKLRKTIKWGGAAVTVLLVVVWVGSMFGWASFSIESGIDVSLFCGSLDVQYGGMQLPGRNLMHGMYDSAFTNLCWWPSWHRRAPGVGQVRCPLWIPLIAAVAGNIVAWWFNCIARQHARLNFCPKCNYDRTGLASKDAKCPECGAAPVSS